MSDDEQQRPPFWIDYAYDRDRASNGYSRYAHYLGVDADRVFADVDPDSDVTKEVAAIAWRFANGPIMAPGFVRHHARVAGARIERSDWESGQMIARVELVSPLPAQLARVRPYAGGWYRTPELDSWANAYYAPSDGDLAKGPYLSALVTVEWSFPVAALSPVASVPAAGMERYRAAVRHVEDVVRVLNRQIAPIIEAMGS